MSGFGTGNCEGCHRNTEGRLPSELRLPCFTSLSRRLNVMTALRRSSPGAQLPGAVFFCMPRRGRELDRLLRTEVTRRSANLGAQRETGSLHRMRLPRLRRLSG